MPTRLSLAVAAEGTDADEIRRFLAAVGRAGLGARDEVLLAATPGPSAGGVELGEVAAAFPGASLTLHPKGTTPMQLWGAAMASARGSHVGVLEVRGLPEPGWVRAWEQAPRDSIVYGPVEPGPLRGSFAWAWYLGEYGQFHRPLPASGAGEIPGNNVVFPRFALPPSSELRDRGFWKTFHLLRLRQRRDPLRRVPAEGMTVDTAREFRPGPFLVRRYLHGRCYGGSRLGEPGAPHRLVCLASAPLLPALRTLRVLRNLRAKPIPARRIAAALLALVLGEFAWSWGELCGYARGAGDACRRLW